MARHEEYDVCVIGTGAGGGVMIEQLTAAGFRVVALQRGPFLQSSDFDDDELRTVIRDQVFSPDRIETYRYDATSPTETGKVNLTAHCVGGTMTHWGPGRRVLHHRARPYPHRFSRRSQVRR